MNIRELADLKPDQRNARRRTPRSLGMIRESIQQYGVLRSIVVDEDGNVLAGNGLIEAAADAGIEQLQVIEIDGDRIPVVVARHLTPEQKREYAVMDNRAGELSEWNTDILAELAAEEGVDLTRMWFDDEFAELIGDEHTPEFGPAGVDEQGRLDETAPKESVTCPQCGETFQP